MAISCVNDAVLHAAPVGETNVVVSVKATQTVRTVDAKLLGVNLVAWDGALNTPATLGLLSELGNPCLRWPGGSWGDAYHWTNEFRGWGSYSSNFIAVATNTQAQAFIIVNYGSSTPEEAAYGVRMFNVTNRCHFKYWEVGNEVFGNWETDDNTNAPWRAHDPWTYALRFTNYYAQMKAVDPTIKVGAVVETGEDSYANYTNHPTTNSRTGQTHHGWTPVMLATLKSLGVTPDFVAYHKYTGMLADSDLLQFSSQWPSLVGDLRQQLNDYLGTRGAAGVEITLTEYNSTPSKQTTSLVGGLFYTDTTAAAMKTEFASLIWWAFRDGLNPKADTNSSYYGWRPYGNLGAVNGSPPAGSADRYPTFYCARLMRCFAASGDTVLSATSDNSLLGAYATRHTNGSLNLLLINKAPGNSFNVIIRLGGYVPRTNATVYSYGIPQDGAARTGIGSADIAQTNAFIAGTNFSYTCLPYSAIMIRLLPKLDSN